MWLNYQRKHVKGFSKLGIVIKHVGASFLWVNSMILGGTSYTTHYTILWVCSYLDQRPFQWLATVCSMCCSTRPSCYSKHHIYASSIITAHHTRRFTLYGDTPESKGNSNYLLWLMFPLVPAMLGMRYPNTISTLHWTHIVAATDSCL